MSSGNDSIEREPVTAANGESGATRSGGSRALVRALRITALALASLIAFTALSVLVLSRTDWGREQVRRFVVHQLEGVVNGQVTIARIRGNLLTSATIEGFAIRDSAGRPFLVADRVSARYGILELLTRKIDLRRVTIVDPLIVLDREPAGKWNYEVIFPPSDSTQPEEVEKKGFRWIVLRNVNVSGGRLIVRTPWKPDTTLSRAAQDTLIREALSGESRIMVVRVPGGFQKVVELKEVSARAPMVRIAHPAHDDRLVQIASLKMVALPFRPPAAVVEDLRGTLRFNDDSLWWSDVAVRAPGSLLRGAGRYEFTSGDMTITASGRPAALADLRWIFPRLPSDGGGPLDFRLEWRGSTEEYVVRSADVRTMGGRIRGDFAVTIADTFAIHDTDLRFSAVSTKLLEQVVPDFVAPRHGVMDGHVTAKGGRHAMQVAGNVAFRDQSGAGTSRARGSAAFGFAPGGSFQLYELDARVDPLQVALVKAMSDELDRAIAPIGGVLVGRLRLSGPTRTSLRIAANVEHRDRGNVSRLDGTGALRLGRLKSFDINARLAPLSLAEVGLLVPDAGLRGTASGPVRARGTFGDLRVETSLAFSGGGSVTGNGRFDLDGRVKTYDVSARLNALDAGAFMASAPSTSVTGSVRAAGAGFDPATMRASIAADLARSTARGVAVDSATVRVAVAGGLARVDRLMALGPSTRIEAAGSFGLARGRTGELRYSVWVDSIGAYDDWVPGAESEGVVRPRPAIIARAIERRRRDSVTVVTATAVERAATGRPMPRIETPPMPPTYQRSALSGSAYAAGTLRGNIHVFDLRGRFAAEDLVIRGSAAKVLRAEYAWTNARTPSARMAIAAEGRKILLRGFAFDTLEARLGYRRPNGEFQIALREGEDAAGRDLNDYSARGSFVIGARNTVRVQDLALRMDTTVWRLAREAVVRWHSGGVEVQDVELRSNKGGLVYARGLLPTEGKANLVLHVENFQVADVASLLQSDLALTGILTGQGLLQGTLQAPTFRGAAGLVNGSYNGSVIPNFRATFNYADQLLVARAEALRRADGSRAVMADASLPINLALASVTGPRLLDRPMRVDVTGDSLPLDLIPAVTDVVEQIQGQAMGSLAMRGTLRRPSIAGALRWTDGSMTVVPLGIRVQAIAASIRMARDTVFVDSIAGRSGSGPLRLAGRVYVGNWREPRFDLHLSGRDATVLDNDRGQLEADLGLSLSGAISDAYIAGLVHVREGAIYIQETSKKQVISSGDPALFQVADQRLLADDELFPVRSPLVANLRLDIDIAIDRNTWLRSRDANIEMYTEQPVRIRRDAGVMNLTGVVSTDRGEYSFMSKRFEIKRGSATFVGSEEVNPLLQAVGEYEVGLAGRPRFNIRVLIGGTLQRPKLTLESDAQPPISQSDLLSYLAFGRSSSSILQIEGSGLTGATATGNLIGVGAAFATRRMAAIALGVMADEVEGEATKGLGADVFNITPADVPTELGTSSIADFLASTRVEAGKYLSPYFFMALQAQKYPGVRAAYRTPKGWRFEASVEPRYLLQPPSLAEQRIAPVSSFGALLIREWRF